MKSRSSAAPVILIIMLSMLIQACAPRHPLKTALPGPLPTSFREPVSPDAKKGVYPSWWQAFGDPGLSRLIQEALSQNLDIAQAAARLKQAEAVLKGENSARFPFLNAQYERSRESQPGFFGTNSGTSYSASLAAGYEIDLWRKFANRSGAARLEKEASRQDLHTVYLTVSCEVADLYYQIIEDRKRVELINSKVKVLKQNLDLVERRYALGLVPSIDVYQARQSLAEARSMRPQLEASVARAEHALSVLLGRYPESPPQTDIIELPFIRELFPHGLSSRLLLKRPDVRAAYLRLRASDSRTAAAIADRFPSINLIGKYGRSSTAFSTGAITGNFWNMALDAMLPIIDAGKRRAEADRARAQAEENLAKYRQAVLRAFQEVEDALAANRAGEERLKELNTNAEISARALELAKDQYMNGLSDYLQVLTAKIHRLDAENSLVTAKRELISERITLIRALGGDWIKPHRQNRAPARQTQEVNSR